MCWNVERSAHSNVYLAAVNEVSQMVSATNAAQIRLSVDIFTTEGRFLFDLSASLLAD